MDQKETTMEIIKYLEIKGKEYITYQKVLVGNQNSTQWKKVWVKDAYIRK